MTEQPGPLETTREFAAIDIDDMLNDEQTYTGPSSRTRLIAIVVIAALVLSVGATTLALILG
ncbi:hypothetical protein BOX37_16345 [Nocardia mangyaensis]|uniref:Uncharacterized protein n=1 Tax=Nocardia mangyaensis TaxID=2213200 RepID=A0A1J0VT94_9NOCA|nr:hypothetical protein [Nocardia mangyaensis]APE35254.1 hypothetical protein BOX37_16345 [Nocardia mangyaensis]MDO3646438.1 hypothetical protein [Nocardia mangyaensis]